jgi:hypothetical protein
MATSGLLSAKHGTIWIAFLTRGSIFMDENLFRSLFDRPFRWPQQGDEPLRKTNNTQHQAEISQDASERMVLLEAGFMRAGKLLTGSALSDRQIRWELTLPALYLYRHAIELGMKSTIATYGAAFGVDCPELHTTHNLKTLWKAFQGLLDAISHPGEEEGNSAAERVVMAFHEWDKHGDAFRYATQRNGSPIILRDYFIDLEQLRDVMEGFENFLSGVDGALDAAQSEDRGMSA